MSALALLFGSCSTAKTDEVIPEDWYLESNIATEYTAGNVTAGPQTVNYLYNADKTLHAIEYYQESDNSYSYLEFVYSNGRFIKTNITSTKGGAMRPYQEFLYSGANLVKVTDADADPVSPYDSLVYDNNRIVKAFTGFSQSVKEYKWENNNVVEAKDYRLINGQMALRFIQQFTYSNIPNPAKTMAIPYYLWNAESNPTLLSANKFKTRTIAGADGIPYSEFTVTYALNEKGLSAGDTTWYRDITGVNPPSHWVSKLTYVNLGE